MRQSQALVLTPQLLQAIKLLQLSSLDLAAYVEGELERNPLLERGVEDGPAAAEQQGSEEGGDRIEVAEADPSDWASAPLETSRTSIEQGMGTELENVFPDDGGGEKQAAPEAQPSAYSEWSGGGSSTERKATTSKPLFLPRSHSRIISPSRWRSPCPIPLSG